MKKIKAMLPYLAAAAAGFYLSPLLITGTGMAMIMLLFVMPVICFVCSIIYGVKKSFNFLFAVFAAVLFLPSVFIFYNSTALIYAAGYGIIALAGNAVGAIFFRRAK